MVLESQGSPGWQPTRKWGPQSYDHKELNASQKPCINFEVDSSLELSDQRPAWPVPCLQTCGTLSRVPSHAPQISDLQNSELPDGCCPEPLSL